MDLLEEDKFMLEFKQASKIFVAVFLCSSLYAKGAQKQVFSYDEKKIVKLTEVAKEKKNYIILIDENCSACEALIARFKPFINSSVILGVINEPSFKWRAKLKRQGFENMVYNIKTLDFDYKEGTPQLYIVDENGSLISRTYGKSNISTIFKSKIKL